MKLLILLLITVTAAHHGFIWMELFHPPFLMRVSWPAQQDYYEILHNQKMTIAQQKQQIMVWAKKNKIMVRMSLLESQHHSKEKNFQKEVMSFFSKFEKRMEKMNQNLAKLVSELPKAVKNLTKIMKNEKQTMPDMMEAVHKLHWEHPQVSRNNKFFRHGHRKLVIVHRRILKTDSFQVFHVLMAAIMEVMRKHGPHGPHGPHPRPHDGPFPFDGPHSWGHHWEQPWEKPWHRRWDDGSFGGWPQGPQGHFPYGHEEPWNREGWQHGPHNGFQPSMGPAGML
ncbi:unnamed protein product [Haemonchus placei]|uniref:DUF148 domain-containing protein n=1 Tax=Haemonchus placei TaxID=6290 RepID=A0A0N4WYG7_HAEPC|nr:unnamed protein product [Haemonchus placei]